MTEDPFAAMMAQLADVEVPEEEDLTLVSSLSLVDELERLDHELSERGELLQVTTAEARELHSRRGAIVVTLKKRGAL